MSVTSSGFDGPDVIAIKLDSLHEWLLSRSIVTPSAPAQLKHLRKHICSLIASAPHDARPLLASVITPSTVTYTSVTAALATLERFYTDRGEKTKSLFFRSYRLPVLRSWSAAVSTYEGGNLFLSEAARSLSQAVGYDLVAARRSCERARARAREGWERARVEGRGAEKAEAEFIAAVAGVGVGKDEARAFVHEYHAAMSSSSSSSSTIAASSTRLGDDDDDNEGFGDDGTASGNSQSLLLESRLDRIILSRLGAAAAASLAGVAAASRDRSVREAAGYYRAWVCAQGSAADDAAGGSVTVAEDAVLESLALLCTTPAVALSPDALASAAAVKDEENDKGEKSSASADAEGGIDWGGIDWGDTDSAPDSAPSAATTGPVPLSPVGAKAEGDDEEDLLAKWGITVSSAPTTSSISAAAAVDSSDPAPGLATAAAPASCPQSPFDLWCPLSRSQLAANIAELASFLRSRLADSAAADAALSSATAEEGGLTSVSATVAGAAGNRGLLAPFAAPALRSLAAEPLPLFPGDGHDGLASRMVAANDTATLTRWLAALAPVEAALGLGLLPTVNASAGPNALADVLLARSSPSYRRRLTLSLLILLARARAHATRAARARAAAAAAEKEAAGDAEVRAVVVKARALKGAVERALGAIVGKKCEILMQLDL